MRSTESCKRVRTFPCYHCLFPFHYLILHTRWSLRSFFVSVSFPLFLFGQEVNSSRVGRDKRVHVATLSRRVGWQFLLRGLVRFIEIARTFLYRSFHFLYLYPFSSFSLSLSLSLSLSRSLFSRKEQFGSRDAIIIHFARAIVQSPMRTRQYAHSTSMHQMLADDHAVSNTTRDTRVRDDAYAHARVARWLIRFARQNASQIWGTEFVEQALTCRI